MADLTSQVLPGGYDYDGTVVTWNTMSAGGDTVPCNGKVFIKVKNDDASPHTFTATSVATSIGRTKDISESIAAGVEKVYGPFPTEGWRNANGKLAIDDGTDAVLKVAVFELQ